MTKAEKQYFKVHEIYGIRKNDEGEWVAFNRSYIPLGNERKAASKKDWVDDKDFPLYGLSKNAHIDKLREIAWGGGEGLKIEDGFPQFVFLYADVCAPWLSKNNLSQYKDRLEKLKRCKLAYLR